MSKVYNKLNKFFYHSKLFHEKKNDLDVFKTHGSNYKISKFSKKIIFTNFDKALLKHLNGLKIIKIYYESKRKD